MIKGDDEAVREYGIQLGTETMRRLTNAGINTLHFYTLNLSRAGLYIRIFIASRIFGPVQLTITSFFFFLSIVLFSFKNFR